MAPKNIDDTIKKLLNAYAQWCKGILDKDLKSIQKRRFYTAEDRKNAIQEHTRAMNAYKFLMQIAKNPQAYLYSGKDLIYADGDLYRNLEPLLVVPFDKSGEHLLVRLSEAIAHHVNYETRYNTNGNWVYYGNVSDFHAESILRMNKVVQLWNANNFVAAIKDFAPASVFAVDAYKRER